MERVNVVVYGLSRHIYSLLAIISKAAFRKHSKVAYVMYHYLDFHLSTECSYVTTK